MISLIKKQSPGRIIAFGFISMIFIGSLLLRLPICVKDGVELSFIDALYTSTSAVCVTGLMVVDAGDTFTPIGQAIIALLIQIGGLGVATMGTGIILLLGKKINIKGRTIIKEAMNLDSRGGMVSLVKHIFLVTLIFELLGAILCLPVFLKEYPTLKAVGVSVFHSIAAFNNAGIDIFGGMRSLSPFADSILMNFVTMGLIIFGGLGFLVINDLWRHKLNFKKLSMHSKVVLTVSLLLIVFGAVLLKLTEETTWLGAVFHSVSARTAGFSYHNFGAYTNAGLLVMMIFMVIGASPGSTGGGVKTTTFFVIFQGINSAATNRAEKAFKYAVPKNSFRKASVIVLMAMLVILIGAYIMSVFEPDLGFTDVFFEVVSAFGTVGLSTGITPTLGFGSKILSIIIMYIGRLGPLTIATLWYFAKDERVRYPEGNLFVG